MFEEVISICTPTAQFAFVADSVAIQSAKRRTHGSASSD
jgi:hypothetical protein